ncbi:MAG: type II toxin-antitoxin system Phd/YefM family antitoxin [Ardenticatenaceae bacterium]
MTNLLARCFVTRRVSAAKARACLSALIAEVAYKGEQVIIERWGKPVAALVSMEDLEHLKQVSSVKSKKPGGALALVGLARELGDDVIDAMVRDIYSARKKDMGRQVELDG